MTKEQALTEQSIRQLPSGESSLVLETTFRDISPEHLFRYWTEPELLTQWWPPEAQVDARLGGTYSLTWPKMNWKLHGHYTAFEQGQTLGFTWQWAHEPDMQTRQVLVTFDDAGDVPGTLLILTHGTYMDTEQDMEEKKGHLEGWTHFLGRLHSVVEGVERT